MKKKLQIALLVFVFYIIQTFSLLSNLVILAIIVVTFILKRNRLVGIFMSLVIGHIVWLFTFDKLMYIFELGYISRNELTILQRLGLIGYIGAFFILSQKFKIANSFSFLGDFKEKIQLPFFFRGNKVETIGRFLIIYLSIFICAIVISSLFVVTINLKIILYAILFSFVNTILENIIWRYYVLEHFNMLYSKQFLLILNALLFGLFHISLGFSLSVCLIYATGGYFMSGITYFYKGLLPTFLMHSIVNIFFVVTGIIPFY